MLGRAVVALVYAAAAVVLTWPLAASLTTRLGALQGAGDPFLNLWILGWGMRAWVTDPLGVLTGRVFDANIFFPARDALTYSDHFLLQALPLAPVYAFTGDAVLCYNLLLIASIAISGLAMHALVKGLTASTPAAIVAGLAWACWPYRTAHVLHIQLQALYFLPLALLALHRLAAGRRWRDAWLLGIAAGLQAIASVYYGVMTMVVVAVAGAALAITTGQWRHRKLLGGLLLAAIVGAVLVAPVLVPYRRSQEAQGFGRNLYEAANHSARLRSYAQVPASNLLYGQTGVLAPRDSVEDQLFPGLTVIALALVGVWTGWRRDVRPIVISACALVVTGIILSLGPDGIRPLYAWLYDAVYGFQAIRAPARFAVVAMLGLLLLAALGVRAVLDAGPFGPGRGGSKDPPLPRTGNHATPRTKTGATATQDVEPLGSRQGGSEHAPLQQIAPGLGRGGSDAAPQQIAQAFGRGGSLDPPRAGPQRPQRTAIAAALIAAVCLEYINAPLPLVPAPPRQTAVGQWLAQEPVPGAVLHLPLTVDIENTPFMVQSLEHWRPIVNGYSGQRPTFFPALVDALADLPDADALATLKELDVRFVVSPKTLAGAGEPASPFVERARFDSQVIYEVRWTPESEAVLESAVDVPPPPPPGVVPFAAGETLTYEVRWDGGRVGLPAGTATLRATDAATGGARWRFEAYAETADWVSSFFQARDRFVTVADASLRPIEHAREIREGRREQDRVFVYDPARRLVRTGQTREEASGAGALSFALTPGARDALTAFYYARTIVVPDDGVVQVPINEAGRNLILMLPAGTEETITHQGQPVRTRRIEPVLQQRIERRRAPQIVVWISMDARRVPLVVEVDAGFGRIRAELMGYAAAR